MSFRSFRSFRLFEGCYFSYLWTVGGGETPPFHGADESEEAGLEEGGESKNLQLKANKIVE